MMVVTLDNDSDGSGNSVLLFYYLSNLPVRNWKAYTKGPSLYEVLTYFRWHHRYYTPYLLVFRWILLTKIGWKYFTISCSDIAWQTKSSPVSKICKTKKFSKCKILIGKILTIQHPFVKIHQTFPPSKFCTIRY